MEKGVDVANCILAQIAKILFIESRNKTIKSLVVLYIFGTVVNWFTFPTLLTTTIILAFLIPKIYEIFQSPIDHYTDLVKRQIEAYLGK